MAENGPWIVSCVGKPGIHPDMVCMVPPARGRVCRIHMSDQVRRIVRNGG